MKGEGRGETKSTQVWTSREVTLWRARKQEGRGTERGNGSGPGTRSVGYPAGSREEECDTDQKSRLRMHSCFLKSCSSGRRQDEKGKWEALQAASV